MDRQVVQLAGNQTIEGKPACPVSQGGLLHSTPRLCTHEVDRDFRYGLAVGGNYAPGNSSEQPGPQLGPELDGINFAQCHPRLSSVT